MLKLRGPISRIVVPLVTLALLVWVFVPYYFLVAVSFVPQGTIITGFERWTVTTLGNYRQVLGGVNAIWPYLINSLVVSLSVAVATVVLGAPAAYAFSHLRRVAVARGLYLSFFVLRMLPPVALVIPYFLLFSRLHMLDTRQGLILSLLPVGLPFFVWTAKVFFDAVPESTEEAARLDGATMPQVFLYIVVPIVSQGLAAIALLTFLLSYVDYIFAATLTGPKAMTLAVYVTSFQNDYLVYVGAMMAATLIGTLPMILVYTYAQRYMRHMALVGKV